MNILVAGGAGYIGSFMTRMLVERGYGVTVLDNLTTGHRASVGDGVAFVEGDLADRAALAGLLAEREIDAVMHFSAFSLVGESMGDPLKYYRNNTANTVKLLQAMASAGVRLFIFSSTAAVFGNPLELPITEAHPVSPINPYGWSKCMVEQVLRDTSAASELRYVSLRYFNAAGADAEGRMGEDHRNETHLIPLMLKAILGGSGALPHLTIFGDDYDTPDGTCVRDYIHVLDLAEAHVLALEHLAAGGESEIFNLGNGQGFSVKEVIDAAERVTGRKVPVVMGDRRPGDPPVLVAGSDKIRRMLGWDPAHADLEGIIDTAWKWHSTHPDGYGAA
jgi:UDP-glucose 4-epimerase